MRRSKRLKALLVSFVLTVLMLPACGAEPAAGPEPTAEPVAEVTMPTPEPTPSPEPPRAGMQLVGPEELEWICGRPYEEPGAIAWEKSGEDRSGEIRVSGEVICWKTGSYTIDYSFTDEDGQQHSLQRVVNVIPAELPEPVPTEKVIYLTFDDGPSPETPRLLDILDKYDVKASFFIVGTQEEQRGYIKEIHDRGHTIGLHCYSHDIPGIYRGGEELYFEDFMKAQRVIYDATGSYAQISRFPGGSVTAWAYLRDDYEAVEQRLRDMGVRSYDWNIQCENLETLSTMQCYYNFIYSVPGYDMSIPLQHDTLVSSVNAVEDMIIWGLENGYEFRALDNTVPEVRLSR